MREDERRREKERRGEGRREKKREGEGRRSTHPLPPERFARLFSAWLCSEASLLVTGGGGGKGGGGGE